MLISLDLFVSLCFLGLFYLLLRAQKLLEMRRFKVDFYALPSDTSNGKCIAG